MRQLVVKRPMRVIPAFASLRYASRQSLFFSSSSRTAKLLENEKDVDEFLATPTWSVKTLLPTEEQIEETTDVTPSQLRHLLRLSALQPPQTPELEAKMLKDLKSQLHFVKEIQKVDTDGVEPMKSIRDESTKAQEAEEITLDTLKDALDQEEIIGKHHKRIKRRKNIQHDAREVEDWDVLGQAPNKVGKYFVIHAAKE